MLHRPKILRWLGMSGIEATEYLDALEQIAQFVLPLKRVPVTIRDIKDIPLLAAALARPVATALITGDMDLLVLKGLVNTDVISPSDFVAKYLSQ